MTGQLEFDEEIKAQNFNAKKIKFYSIPTLRDMYKDNIFAWGIGWIITDQNEELDFNI